MRNSQNIGYVIAVLLGEKIYGGFTWVLRENSAIHQVNDDNDFETLKFGGTIEWE